MTATYTEDHLVEQPAIRIFRNELGWDAATCFDEWSLGTSSLGREAKRDVVLVSRLRPALERLNPGYPGEAIEGAIDELTRDRSALGLGEANQEVYKLFKLFKQGVKVQVPNRWCQRG